MEPECFCLKRIRNFTDWIQIQPFFHLMTTYIFYLAKLCSYNFITLPAIFNFYVVVNRFFSACSGQDLRITHSFPHPNYRIAQWCGSVWISIRIRKFSMTIRIRIRNFSIQIQGKNQFSIFPQKIYAYTVPNKRKKERKKKS